MGGGVAAAYEVGRVAGVAVEKRRRPVLCVGGSAAALKRYRHAGMMKFEEASDDAISGTIRIWTGVVTTDI